MNSGSVNHSITDERYFRESNGGIETNDGTDFGIVEASFGENILDCEPRDRYLYMRIHCFFQFFELFCMCSSIFGLSRFEWLKAGRR